MLRSFALAAFLSLTILATASAQPRVNTNGGDAAVGGYDVVAYFEDGRPVRGSADFEHRWQGATWRFVSAAHLAVFREHPARYAPQYGGFCAYAMASGDRVRIDPTAWSIVGGKLYLNYDAGVQRRWEANRANYIRRADRQWAGH